MPLGETEKMLEIWSAVKVAQKIQVDLDRKGEIHTYTFLVRNYCIVTTRCGLPQRHRDTERIQGVITQNIV